MVGFPFHFLFSTFFAHFNVHACECLFVDERVFSPMFFCRLLVAVFLFCKKFVERIGVFSALLFDAYVDPEVPFLQLPNICAVLEYQTQVRMRTNACISYPSSISCRELFLLISEVFGF